MLLIHSLIMHIVCMLLLKS